MDSSDVHSCTCECHECEEDTLHYDEDCCVYLQPAPPTNTIPTTAPQGGRLGAVWAVEDECAALLRQLGEDAGAGGLSAPLHRTLSTLCRCVQLLASSSTDTQPLPPTPPPQPQPPAQPDNGTLRPMQADIEYCLERLEAIEERLHSGGGGDRRNNKDVKLVGRAVDDLKARVDAVEGNIDVLISEVHRGLASVDRKMGALNNIRREAAATPTTTTSTPITIAAPLAVHQSTTDGGGCRSAPGGLQWMRRHFPNAPLEAPIRWDEPPTHIADGVQSGLLPCGSNLLVLRPGVYTLELVVVLSCVRGGFAKASGKPGPLAEVRWCVDGGSVWQSKGGSSTRHSITPSPLNVGEFPATSAHHDAVYTQVVSNTISLSLNAQSKIGASITIDDLLLKKGGGGVPSRCDGCRSLQRPPAQQCALAQYRAQGNTP